MTPNRKLTHVIKERTVKETAQTGGLLTITFTDGSTMKIKTSVGVGQVDSRGREVKDVRQNDESLHLDFTDGSTLEVPLAEATSSVMLRDAQNVLEYAD
jgi:hypothetical protein